MKWQLKEIGISLLSKFLFFFCFGKMIQDKKSLILSWAESLTYTFYYQLTFYLACFCVYISLEQSHMKSEYCFRHFSSCRPASWKQEAPCAHHLGASLECRQSSSATGPLTSLQPEQVNDHVYATYLIFCHWALCLTREVQWCNC